jgi:hypothetical protein
VHFHTPRPCNLAHSRTVRPTIWSFQETTVLSSRRNTASQQLRSEAPFLTFQISRLTRCHSSTNGIPEWAVHVHISTSEITFVWENLYPAPYSREQYQLARLSIWSSPGITALWLRKSMILRLTRWVVPSSASWWIGTNALCSSIFGTRMSEPLVRFWIWEIMFVWVCLHNWRWLNEDFGKRIISQQRIKQSPI